MKQFAFPLSIKCASVEERDECVKLLESIGYKTEDIDDLLYVTNCYIGYMGVCGTITNTHHVIYARNRHHIDHFNPALIRDIASACTNDTWQKGEAALVFDASDNIYYYDIVDGLIDEKVCKTKSKRPTIAEICEHHGYEIKGRDIVKKQSKQNNMKHKIHSHPSLEKALGLDSDHVIIDKFEFEKISESEKISNCDKSYCETAMRLDEATAEINRLKSENADFREKLEWLTDVDNQEIERLRNENAELKAQRIMCMEAFHAIKNRETKIKDLLEDIISDMY